MPVVDGKWITGHYYDFTVPPHRTASRHCAESSTHGTANIMIAVVLRTQPGRN
jgi:hypothetical protein